MNSKVAATGGGGLVAGSNASQGGGSGRGDVRKVVGLQDFTFGEMIGRGSYSTVSPNSVDYLQTNVTDETLSHQVVLARQNATHIPYAIKILDQAHLIQQKKTKYAKVERDALVRLGPQVRSNGNRGSTMSIMSNSGGMGHKRRESGHSLASSSASGGTLLAAGTDPGKPRRRRESNEGGWNVPARRTSTFQSSVQGSSYGRSYGTSISSTMNLEHATLPETNGEAEELKSIEPEEPSVNKVDRQQTIKPEADRQQTIKPDLSRLTIPPSPLLSGKDGNGQTWSPSAMSTSPSEATTVTGRGSTELPDVARAIPRKRKRASHPGVIRLHYTFKDHTSLC